MGYGPGQKGYGCFDPVSQKLYVSHHVKFLKHIPFFFIPASSHNMTTSYLICINPFTLNSEVVPPHVSHSPAPTLDLDSCRVPIDSSIVIGTLAPNTYATTSPLAAAQSPPKTSVPPPTHLVRIRKSTQLPDFAYSCYSSSFISFLAFYLSYP